jgi:hypothetical protein
MPMTLGHASTRGSCSLRRNPVSSAGFRFFVTTEPRPTVPSEDAALAIAVSLGIFLLNLAVLWLLEKFVPVDAWEALRASDTRSGNVAYLGTFVAILEAVLGVRYCWPADENGNTSGRKVALVLVPIACAVPWFVFLFLVGGHST